MKSLGAVTILFLTAVTSFGQLTLKPGNTWWFQFGSMPFFGTTHFGPPSYVPLGIGGGGFSYNIAMEPGSALRVEQFEEVPTGVPLSSVVTTSAAETNFPGAIFSWNDLNGAIRFTMLTGSVTIASIRLFNWQNTGPPFAFTGYEFTYIPQSFARTVIVERPTSSIAIESVGFPGPDDMTLTYDPWIPLIPPGSPISIGFSSTGAMPSFRFRTSP